MKVELSTDVKAYLTRKHQDVLEVYCRHVHYPRFGDEFTQLEIEFGAPDPRDAEKFTSFDVDRFRVYVETDLLEENKDVAFHIKNVLGFKHLEVDGIKREP